MDYGPSTKKTTFTPMQITAQELAGWLNGTVDGDPNVTVNNLAKIEEAKSGDLSFIANPKYLHFAPKTSASVLIVGNDFAKTDSVKATLVRVADPYAAFAQLLEKYASMTAAVQESKIEQPCFIADTAKVGSEVYIGAHSYIAEGAVIGNKVKIYPGCYIGANVEVGEGSTLYPSVIVYHNCSIGKRVMIHAGSVIGSDGFGFAPQPDGSFKKVPQTGNVVIEDDVEIGANTVIDRATLGSTVIRRGVKLDNLIQVAHNVEIGEHTVIASQTGISGSTKLGKHVMVGGQVGFAGHLTIADGTKFQAQTGVAQSIKTPNGAYAGSPAHDYNKQIKTFITLRNLPEMERRLRELENKLAALTKPADE